MTRLRTISLALGAACAIGALGCGGSAIGATNSDASEDGNGIDEGAVVPAGDGAASDGDVAPTDAGAFPCGDAQCDPSQICLTPGWGCIGLPRNDGGACPEGTEFWDAIGPAGVCLPPPPPPSCVSPAPGEGSFDCSEGGAYPSCGTVNAPIPSGCSRICRGICL
jgi:hypothetical protein